MAGTNNFLLFNEQFLNALADVDYQAEVQRTGGLSDGIAKTQMHNKLFRQLSIMVTALAQVMYDQGQAVSDTDLAALKTAILNSFQKQAATVLGIGIDASTYLWQNGIYSCTTAMTNMPAAHAYLVEANVVDNNNITLRASDLTSAGLFFQRQKIAGVWGTWLSVGGSPGADAKEITITGTVAQTILTYTPAAAGNFLVGTSFRVITGTTNVTLVVSYTDASGAQTNTQLSAQVCAVGTYSVPLLFINAAAGSAITVTVTGNVANQVIASASVEGV